MSTINCNGAWFNRDVIYDACVGWVTAVDASIKQEREEMISELIEHSKKVRKNFWGKIVSKEKTRERAIKQLKTYEPWSMQCAWELPYRRTHKTRGTITSLQKMCLAPSIDDKVFVSADTMATLVGYMK